MPHYINVHFTYSVSTTPGNPGNLLEFVWSSWKFCIKCRWSTSLVSSHDKTGYLIASLRNWSSFFIFATVLFCAYHVFVIYLGKLVDSVHYIAGRSNANMSWIFLEIPPGISWKFVQLNL